MQTWQPVLAGIEICRHPAGASSGYCVKSLALICLRSGGTLACSVCDVCVLSRLRFSTLCHIARFRIRDFGPLGGVGWSRPSAARACGAASSTAAVLLQCVGSGQWGVVRSWRAAIGRVWRAAEDAGMLAMPWAAVSRDVLLSVSVPGWHNSSCDQGNPWLWHVPAVLCHYDNRCAPGLQNPDNA